MTIFVAPRIPRWFLSLTSKAVEVRLHLRRFVLLAVTLCVCMGTSSALTACTGITLKAKDGTIVYGRTMEWGTFDLHSRVNIISRGFKFTGQTPDGRPGLTWTAKYGVVGIDGVMKDIILDGMNEKGMTVGLFYHPGFAEYQKYDPAQASDSIGPTDVGQYLLSTCETIEEARQALQKIHVVPVPEAALGFVPPVHYMVTDATGKQIVIEFLKGEMKIFDAPLGVITNAPNYDWHETNLRNYINLSPVGIPDKKIGDLDFKAMGGGSGMIGLPGDFTPPPGSSELWPFLSRPATPSMAKIRCTNCSASSITLMFLSVQPRAQAMKRLRAWSVLLSGQPATTPKTK